MSYTLALSGFAGFAGFTGSWTGSRVLGSGFWVLGFRFWVLGSGFWVLGSGFWVLFFGFWVLVSGFWVPGQKLPKKPESNERTKSLKATKRNVRGWNRHNLNDHRWGFELASTPRLACHPASRPKHIGCLDN